MEHPRFKYYPNDQEGNEIKKLLKGAKLDRNGVAELNDKQRTELDEIFRKRDLRIEAYAREHLLNYLNSYTEMDSETKKWIEENLTTLEFELFKMGFEKAVSIYDPIVRNLLAELKGGMKKQNTRKCRKPIDKKELNKLMGMKKYQHENGKPNWTTLSKVFGVDADTVKKRAEA